MQSKIFILGAGGMAREVFQLFADLNQENRLEAFWINNNTKYRYVKLPLSVITRSPNRNAHLINGIGSPLRCKWIEQLEKKYEFESITHPSALIGKNSKIGVDTIISANCVISTNVKIGKHTIVNLNSTISHDCLIGEYVTVSPGVSIGGRVRIGKCVFIGIGSTIIQDVSIGSNVFLGAGSVVVNDIPSNSLAFGNPAKVIKKLSVKDWEDII